jgi:hypothetical protein
MHRSTELFLKYKILIASLIVVFLYSATLVLASGGPYAPHGTLDPACLPTNNTCYVTSPTGGVTIGDTVQGGTPNQILYTDGSGNVTSDAFFTRDFSNGGNTTIESELSGGSAEGGLYTGNNFAQSGAPGAGLLYFNNTTGNHLFSFVGDATNLGFNPDTVFNGISASSGQKIAFSTQTFDPTFGYINSLQAFNDKTAVTYTAPSSGSFQEGEVVTGGTSGATGHVTMEISTGMSISNVVGGPFQTGEVITGGTSGATATLATAHQVNVSSSMVLDNNVVYLQHTGEQGISRAFNIGDNLIGYKPNPGTQISFPLSDGTAGQAMVTDGNGNLSWATVSGGGSLTATQVAFGDGSNVMTSSAHFIFNNDILTVGGTSTALSAQFSGSGLDDLSVSGNYTGSA